MNKFITLIFLFIFFSCQTEKEEKNTKKLNTPEDSKITKSNLKYSKCFEIMEQDNIKKLIIHDPFLDYKIQKTFILLKADQNYTPLDNEIIIKVPIETIIPFSTSYLSMIDTLGELNSIVAIENKNYVYNPELLKRITNKEVKTIGSIDQLNIESVIMSAPDLIITIGNPGETSKQIQKIEKAGIPHINNYDWQETHPLGKAEWIKFFGALYNKEEEANQIFNFIESNYNQLKKQRKKNNPNVLFSSLYNGVWYIPGGNSYGSQFLKDAGGSYPWINDSTTGSLPLSFETIANKQSNPDIWLSPNYNNINEMVNDDNRYTPFLNSAKGRIYKQNKRTTILGGNDYWEKGALRADLVLKDYIELFQLDSCNDDSLLFFNKVNP